MSDHGQDSAIWRSEVPTGDPTGDYLAVVIGASAGGLRSLTQLLTNLSDDFALPVFLAQHLHFTDQGRFAEHLNDLTPLCVVEASDKLPIAPRTLYVAPANYHLLVERNGTLALSIDARVNFSRPSIDVLFESAAWVYGAKLIAVILSGASDDGARGMKRIRELGGLNIAEDPESAEYAMMPMAAIKAAGIEAIHPPAGIGQMLSELQRQTQFSAENSEWMGRLK